MADFKDLLHSTPIGILILAGFGGLFFAAKVFSFVRLLFSCFVLSGTSLRKYGHKGSWAVVTGASDGIGKEFAMQLVRQGYNIFLVSRTQSKLQSLAEELYSSAHVQTEILAMDFAKNRDEDFDRLKSMVEDLDVAILVNNVGKSHDMPVPFIETAKQEMNEIITINCIGTLKVTQIVAPIMVRRRRGLILTMGSFGGLCPTPLLATYSGSKAFLQQWSTALGGEMKKHGVDVELVMSYLVTSAMSKVKRPSLLIPTPRQFVKAALGKIGRSGGSQGISSTSTPYWSHAIFHWALATFIGLMSPFIIYQNRLMHEDIRKRALKKQEREAKKAT